MGSAQPAARPGIVSNRAGDWRQVRWVHEVPGMAPGWGGLWQHFKALVLRREVPLQAHQVAFSAWVTGGRSVKVQAAVSVDLGVCK
jgi:hypothetical protein